MYAPVVVVEPEDFRDWLAGKEVEAPSPGEETPAERGARVAQETGCLSCHSVDGSDLVGPTWLDLFGSERQFEDGSTAVADESYLLNSIVNPGDQIVAGYPNIMSPAYSNLPDEDLDALVEYIKSLSE
jgi:cytochrome c oxidase subunit 2